MAGLNPSGNLYISSQGLTAIGKMIIIENGENIYIGGFKIPPDAAVDNSINKYKISADLAMTDDIVYPQLTGISGDNPKITLGSNKINVLLSSPSTLKFTISMQAVGPSPIECVLTSDGNAYDSFMQVFGTAPEYPLNQSKFNFNSGDITKTFTIHVLFKNGGSNVRFAFRGDVGNIVKDTTTIEIQQI
jgi:hypothetical protein